MRLQPLRNLTVGDVENGKPCEDGMSYVIHGKHKTGILCHLVLPTPISNFLSQFTELVRREVKDCIDDQKVSILI